MLKRRCKILLSLVLVLSIIIVGVCHADTVYVAGAPGSSASGNAQGTTAASSQAASASGQRLYPGSIGNVDDSPKTNVISSPAANNSKINTTSGGTSNVISNGYTWETKNDNVAPVSHDISSPAAHQAEMKSGSKDTSIIGQDAQTNMGYVAPGGTTQNVNYSGSGFTTAGSQYPQSNISSTPQSSTATT
ncbi:MAG: hypothetical protein MJ151_04030 [Lachnospiraceae bacterium]|nr:hypothetical protein [Lachnospiraceae bacterium]